MNHGRRKGDIRVAAATWERHQRIEHTILAGAFLVLAIPALYMVKSALGIDLLPGPSPLHDYLFWMVR
jgi:hypothetical protein